jgi:hypothetical protein
LAHEVLDPNNLLGMKMLFQVQVVIEQHPPFLVALFTSKTTSCSLVPNDKIDVPIKVVNLFLYIYFGIIGEVESKLTKARSSSPILQN